MCHSFITALECLINIFNGSGIFNDILLLSLLLHLLLSAYMCIPNRSILSHLFVETNRILLLLFLLLSVYMCVPNELILLHLFVESVSNGSPRLCPGRVALREYNFRTTVNTCMLQSRGGARTSKPLFHRFLLERKEWNVSSLATPRPYCLIDRSATWSVCRPVIVDYIVSFASS
jgi:hypothetical protein